MLSYLKYDFEAEVNMYTDIDNDVVGILTELSFCYHLHFGYY